MERQLFSLTKIAADFIDVASLAESQQISEEQVLRNAATAIDEPYELAIDDMWHFGHAAIARIKVSLA